MQVHILNPNSPFNGINVKLSISVILLHIWMDGTDHGTIALFPAEYVGVVRHDQLFLAATMNKGRF